jgi:two-component system cell cycle sensor histidine kinase PleC
LRKVFGNLISNAIRFTPPGGTVSVEARAMEQGGAAVCVRDTGLGMSSEEIAVALSPFAQVDASRSRWREGAGLGLPIAKALVQLHGGRLDIRSARSLGTEVTVTLPSRFEVSGVHDRTGLGGDRNNRSDRILGNSRS